MIAIQPVLAGDDGEETRYGLTDLGREAVAALLALDEEGVPVPPLRRLRRARIRARALVRSVTRSCA